MRHSLFLILGLLPAAAATAQHSSCSVSAPAIHLGTYTGTRNESGVTPVSVICPVGMTYTVSLRSTAAGSGNRLRALNGSRGARLNYQLFQDASHSLNWGSEVGTDAVAGVGTGSVQRFNIYPVVMQGQQPIQGNFADTVIVSVTSNRGTFSTSVPVVALASTVCLFGSLNLVFGNYSASTLDGSTVLSLTCLAAVPIEIALNAGTTTGATTSARKMAGSNGGTLNYGLYRDSQRTQNWGSTSGTDTFVGTSTGLLQSITVYGRIPAGQVPLAGLYTDTITATVTY